jgi:hypothetical protein
MIYLVKANDDLASPCGCVSTPIAAPVQKDCPWCGCGWLFVCLKCRKPFAFARAEEVDATWDELARLDARGDAEEWIDFMKVLLKDLRPGATYVYLDGWIFRADQTDLRFDGWHAKHDFPRPPHVVGRGLIDRTLGTREYWESRRVLTET